MPYKALGWFNRFQSLSKVDSGEKGQFLQRMFGAVRSPSFQKPRLI